MNRVFYRQGLMAFFLLTMTLLMAGCSQADKAEELYFEGKTMGVLVASTWAELAKPLKPGETKYYPSESDAFLDVKNKKVDGMITDSIAAAWAIEKSGLPLRIVPGYLSRIQKG